MSFKLLADKDRNKDAITGSGIKSKTLDNLKIQYGSKYETGLLAICFHNPPKLAELRSKITDQYFLFEHNKIAYVALCSLQDNPKVEKIDTALLIQAAKDLGIYETGVGDQYFVVLSSLTPDEANYEFYLNQVTESYNKYKLTLVADSLKEKAFESRKNLDKDQTVKEITSSFIAELSSLEAGGEDEIITLSEVWDTYYSELKDSGTGIPGISTGFPILDQYINGLTDGSLTIFAAAAKQGKSSLLLNMALSVISQYDKDVLYLSTEMPTKQDSYRLLSMVSGVNLSEILQGYAFTDPEKKEKLDLASKLIATKYAPKLHMQYLPFFNADVVFNKIRLGSYKYKIGLAIFDYIKLDTVERDGPSIREDQVLGDLTNYLKMAAGKCNIPVLSACQINTRSNNIADSDRLIRYCDTLVRIDNMSFKEIDQSNIDSLKKYGTTWLTVVANRSGRCGRVPVTHYKPRLQFRPAEFKEPEEQEKDKDYILNNLVPEMESPPNHIETVADAIMGESGNDYNGYDNYSDFDDEEPLF